MYIQIKKGCYLMKNLNYYQEQVLLYIKAHFYMEYIKVDVLDDYTLKVTDEKGETLKFKYSWNKIIVKE